MRIDDVLKPVMTGTTIESSSDLIVTLYEIFAKVDDTNFLAIDPIYRWEYLNWHDEWTKNVTFIQKYLKDLDDSDYEEIERSYAFVIDFMLKNDTLSRIYKLDESDHLGWKILKELREKRELVKKSRIVAQYNREKAKT